MLSLFADLTVADHGLAVGAESVTKIDFDRGMQAFHINGRDHLAGRAGVDHQD
ncbi:hypothetical protein D3C73_1603150 [compost metagenome]